MILEEINIVKPGNLVEYKGRSGNFPFISLIDIDKTNNESVFSFKHPIKGSEFVGYEENVRCIPFTEEHLQLLKFQFDDKSKIHSFNNFKIKRVGYIEKNDSANSLGYVSLELCVILDNFQNNAVPEEMKKNAITLLFVHSLQNYCELIKENGIDFSLLK